MLFSLNHQIYYFCKHDERTVFHPRAWPDCLLSARASAPVWRGGGPADQDSGRPGDRAPRLPLAGGAEGISTGCPVCLVLKQGAVNQLFIEVFLTDVFSLFGS